MKNTFRIGIILVLTLCFLLIALWGIDLSEAYTALRQAQWQYFVLVVGFYLLTHTVRTLRLWVLLEKKGTFASMFSINTIGFLAINVIPLRLGEMVRPYLLSEKWSIPFPKGLAAILLERLLDMCMLLFMLFGLTWFVDLPEQGVQVAGVDVISTGQKVVAVLVSIGIVGGGSIVFLGEHVSCWLQKMPFGQRLSKVVKSFQEGMATLFTHPKRALYLFFLSTMVWVFTVTAVGFAMAAFQGVPVGIAPAWTVWTITISGMVVAPTPGFIGVYEVFCAAALWLWAVEHTVATTFALALHASQLLFTVVIGVTFLMYEGIALRTVVAASRQATTAKRTPQL